MAIYYVMETVPTSLPPWCAMVERDGLGCPNDETWKLIKTTLDLGVWDILANLKDVLNGADVAPSAKEMKFDYTDCLPSEAERDDPNFWCFIVDPTIAFPTLKSHRMWVRIKAKLHRFVDNTLSSLSILNK